MLTLPLPPEFGCITVSKMRRDINHCTSAFHIAFRWNVRKCESPAVASLYKMQQVGVLLGGQGGWHLGWQIVTCRILLCWGKCARAVLNNRPHKDGVSVRQYLYLYAYLYLYLWAASLGCECRNAWEANEMLQRHRQQPHPHLHPHSHIHIPSSRQSEAAPPHPHAPILPGCHRLDQLSVYHGFPESKVCVFVVLPLLRCHGIFQWNRHLWLPLTATSCGYSIKMKTSKKQINGASFIKWT